jgi:hypothetical protein
MASKVCLGIGCGYLLCRRRRLSRRRSTCPNLLAGTGIHQTGSLINAEAAFAFEIGRDTALVASKPNRIPLTHMTRVLSKLRWSSKSATATVTHFLATEHNFFCLAPSGLCTDASALAANTQVTPPGTGQWLTRFVLAVRAANARSAASRANRTERLRTRTVMGGRTSSAAHSRLKLPGARPLTRVPARGVNAKSWRYRAPAPVPHSWADEIRPWSTATVLGLADCRSRRGGPQLVIRALRSAWRRDAGLTTRRICGLPHKLRDPDRPRQAHVALGPVLDVAMDDVDRGDHRP